MFYGLATMEEEFLADNLFTFAAIDPCTIDVSEGDALYEEGLFHFDEYGIYVFGGPNWSEDRKTICDNFSQEVCDYADSTSGGEPVSLKTNVHWAQNTIQYRFQEYAPDYMEGKTHTKLYDLSSIKKVPISIWSGELDVTCSNWEARNTKEIIGERVTHFRTVRAADHGWWGGKVVSDHYLKELERQLIDPEGGSNETSFDPFVVN